MNKDKPVELTEQEPIEDPTAIFIPVPVDVTIELPDETAIPRKLLAPTDETEHEPIDDPILLTWL